MKKLIVDGLKQIYAVRRLLLLVYTPILALFLLLGILSQVVPSVKMSFFLRDVSSLGKLPVYAGLISQLGLLIWSASVTLCFFNYFTLKKFPGARKEALNLLLFAGFFTGYLMLDDAFLFHETVFPSIYVPEKVVYLGLIAATIAFLYFNWKEILKSEYGLLLSAFALFGMSVGFDSGLDMLLGGTYIFTKIEQTIEDFAKMTAIVMWCIFYTRYGFQQLSALIVKQNPAS